MRKSIFAVALAVLFLAPAQRSRATTVFTGEDVGAGPGDATPLSSAAQASFATAASAIGTVGLINFESAPLGSFTSLVVAPGVTISGADEFGDPLFISNTPNYPASPQLDGFNTTPGGSQYVEVTAGTLTFTFANPIQFFGAYLTGVQSPYFYQDTITFSDGTSQTIDIPGTDSGSSGAVDFVGFTDAGASITSVSINSGVVGPGGYGDYIGVDDVNFQVTTTPEPGSFALVLTGILAIGCERLRRRRRV